MSGERGGFPPVSDAKVWDPLFLSKRDFKEEDVSYVEDKRVKDALGDDINLFLQESADAALSCEAEELKEFCRGVRLNDLKSGAVAVGKRRVAWLDDRSCPLTHGVSDVREYENPLTATELYRLLRELRFGHPDKPDADRRLIYIANLKPYYILALSETASRHQVPVLRDALCKHLTLRTSIRVKFPSIGYPIFHIEFHLPYFSLRTSQSPKDLPRPEVLNRKSIREWTDLSFLKPRQDPKVFGIYDACTSFVICGVDDSRWSGYAFVDTNPHDDDLEDKDYCYGEGWHEDPIILGVQDANRPLWNPREYFLKVVQVRVAQVLEEWENLVRTLECSIKQYRNGHPPTLSGRSGTTGKRAEEVKENFDWTLQTRELLSKLLGVISETIKAWEIFNSPDGDKGYFSGLHISPNTPSGRIRHPLRAIKETFDMLEGLQRRLSELERSCRDAAKALELRLILEGNEAVQQNGIASELTLWVISPIMLATACVSMPPAVIPFTVNLKSFVVSIIVIFLVVTLFFYILDALLRRPRWWKRITAWIPMVQLNQINWLIDDMYKRWNGRTRGHKYPERITDDVEMPPVLN